MDGKQTVIQPFELDRGACEPQVNPESFVLKDVDRRESVYSRILGLLEGAGIPDGHSIESEVEYPWDLYVMLHYRQDWHPSGYGLGELLHTMSLLPNEEVTMEFKTWETDKRLEEKDTTIEEKNLSDNKDTRSTSSEVTDSMQTKERTYVDAKASYSGFAS